MFNHQLRKAIAQAFPSRYNRLTWRMLLADFVNKQMLDFLTHLERYEQQRDTNPAATYPVISEELKQAATLRAKQENLNYESLAFHHYLLQIELAATQRQAEHYQQQAAGYESLTGNYKNLADQAIDTVQNATDPKKRRN